MSVFTQNQVADTARRMISALEGVVDDITTEPQEVIAEAEILLKTAESAASQLTSANKDYRGLVDTIVTNISALLSLLAKLPLPPQAVLPVRLASVLLPALIAAANILWPKVTA